MIFLATDSAGAVNTIGAVCGALLALSALAILVYKAVRWFDRLQEIVVRSEAKTDVAVAAITPNGGKSLADDVAKLQKDVATVMANQETGRAVLEFTLPEILQRLSRLEDKTVSVNVSTGEVPVVDS